MNCIFCRIASGEIESNTVYQDDQVVAFRDLNPQAPTHILVIPREHIGGPGDIDQTKEQIAGHLIAVASKIAQQEGIANEGYRLVLNQGTHGGQSVLHMHVHLLGGRQMTWPPG